MMYSRTEKPIVSGDSRPVPIHEVMQADFEIQVLPIVRKAGLENEGAPQTAFALFEKP